VVKIDNKIFKAHLWELNFSRIGKLLHWDASLKKQILFEAQESLKNRKYIFSAESSIIAWKYCWKVCLNVKISIYYFKTSFNFIFPL